MTFQHNKYTQVVDKMLFAFKNDKYVFSDLVTLCHYQNMVEIVKNMCQDK